MSLMLFTNLSDERFYKFSERKKLITDSKVKKMSEIPKRAINKISCDK